MPESDIQVIQHQLPFSAVDIPGVSQISACQIVISEKSLQQIPVDQAVNVQQLRNMIVVFLFAQIMCEAETDDFVIEIS